MIFWLTITTFERKNTVTRKEMARSQFFYGIKWEISSCSSWCIFKNLLIRFFFSSTPASEIKDKNGLFHGETVYMFSIRGVNVSYFNFFHQDVSKLFAYWRWGDKSIENYNAGSRDCAAIASGVHRRVVSAGHPTVHLLILTVGRKTELMLMSWRSQRTVLWRPQSIKVRLCLTQKGQRGFLAHFRLTFMTYVPKQHSEGTLIFHLVSLPAVHRALALRHGSDWHWGTHIFPSFHSGFPPRLALSALLCPLPLGRPSPS